MICTDDSFIIPIYSEGILISVSSTGPVSPPVSLCSNRKKEYMSRRMSEMDRLLSERHLFHGTSADVVEGICKHNFDPRVCGKHATMFGQGSYFARKAVYSHNFSKRSPKGVHCMFLAKVLTGRCVCYWLVSLGCY